MNVRPPAIPPRRRAAMVCALAVGAALLAGGLLCAAILVPAPAAVLPLLGVVCVGFPMLAAWELARVHVALGGLASALRFGGLGSDCGSSAPPFVNDIGIVKIRSAGVLSWGQNAGSVARLNGRDTSNSMAHLLQRKSYNGMDEGPPAFLDPRLSSTPPTTPHRAPTPLRDALDATRAGIRLY